MTSTPSVMRPASVSNSCLSCSTFTMITVLTIYVILDIEYPRLGFIRIDAIDHLLVDLRAGMK